MYPPSAGGEVPTHPLALVAVSTSDAEGDVEARSFQLYQYGRIGRRVVLSAVKGLGPFMDQVPEAPLCLPKGESTKALVVAVDAARKHALAEGGQGWDEESTFEALRKRLAQEDHAPQWSLHRAPKGDGVLIQPYWINAGGTDMVLEWASLGGSATPALFKPLTGLVRASTMSGMRRRASSCSKAPPPVRMMWSFSSWRPGKKWSRLATAPPPRRHRARLLCKCLSLLRAGVCLSNRCSSPCLHPRPHCLEPEPPGRSA